MNMSLWDSLTTERRNRLANEKREIDEQRLRVLEDIREVREDRKQLLIANNPDIITMTNNIDESLKIANKQLSLAATLTEARNTLSEKLGEEFDSSEGESCDAEYLELYNSLHPAPTLDWGGTGTGTGGFLTYPWEDTLKIDSGNNIIYTNSPNTVSAGAGLRTTTNLP